MDKCLEHSGHASRIKNLETDQKMLDHSIGTAHRRIDSIKNWVVAGMAALILQLILHIITLVGKVQAAPPVP